jgi:hypothetical protein
VSIFRNTATPTEFVSKPTRGNLSSLTNGGLPVTGDLETAAIRWVADAKRKSLQSGLLRGTREGWRSEAAAGGKKCTGLAPPSLLFFG